ncbi:MAG: 1-(5-phosphoribosyl)-5-[(5-phosphoribosylamino)methylideneamino]imidazole-4-carboxamide isomerase [Desulfobacteraceae bacterium]|nr:1-(5-phosphoribosyl)-5-[(5-phosphoribosylamino)methylideneamino]imidazole-4-carboxamide isomerase [Desulfobacteraceae bacterium]
MLIIPAIDIKQGKCVRLQQGNMDLETQYSDNPLEMALKWEALGAELIHIVDLDGAFEKQIVNHETIKHIVKNCNAPIQVGGGIRNEDTVKMYLELGVQRVIIGSEALYNPDFVIEICKKHPGKIVVGIDAKNGMVAVEGWSEVSDVSAIDLAKKYESKGVAAIIFTDIKRDGMQTGPNIEATNELAQAVNIPVIASGGVSTIEDIKDLIKYKEIFGVITGRALYEGKLDLKEAIKISI